MLKKCRASREQRRSRYADARKQRTSNAYDRWSRVWNLARYTNRSIYGTVLALLDERHHRVLDVGCGTGLMSAKLAAGGRRVLGVDLSSDMIARARRRRSARVDFMQGDAEQLALESSGFDAVVNLISFHHYPAPSRALAEFRRVLRPGGRLVLVLFDRNSRYIKLAQQVNPWVKSIAGEEWQKTSDEMRALVSSAGFVRIEIQPVRYWIKTFVVVADTLDCPLPLSVAPE
jgi:ubiquinone/menaquinone biosynthesis C-methylase UbiE